MAFAQDQITSQVEGIAIAGSINKLTTVSNSLLGGNIVSILLRQAILLKSFRPPITPGSSSVQPVSNPKVFVAGIIPVTTRSQEAYTYQADVTNHAVESGSIFSDHVILHPIRVDLSFEISNWTYGDAKSALEALEKVWKDRGLLSFQTEHKQLNNYVCTHIQAENSVPEWGKLTCHATFQQVNLVTIGTVKFPAEKVTKPQEQAAPDNKYDSAEKSATTPKKRGNVRAYTPNAEDQALIDRAQSLNDEWKAKAQGNK